MKIRLKLGKISLSVNDEEIPVNGATERGLAFAHMALLIAMPETQVKWFIQDRKIDMADAPARVAAEFNVPVEVARYRLIQLGLLPGE